MQGTEGNGIVRAYGKRVPFCGSGAGAALRVAQFHSCALIHRGPVATL